MRLDDFEDFLADALVKTHVGSLREESFQNLGFPSFGAKDSHGNL
jgi:hypothetical protein